MSVIHICGGRMVELQRVPDGERWCFGCRATLPHDVVQYGDPEPSYWEPVWRVECSRCHKNRTRFPR